MNTPPKFPRAKLRGLTGDNHDRDRLAVSFDREDGETVRLSLTIKDLNALGEMTEWAIPTLTESWRQRDEAQR
ncbi:hypothetical protein [Ruegeria sp. HKCCD8929]|uniref:hypothetical protein n=1 Tax=Ruegeria sp. HKCCD8929 TaxID=2683006 RepID=UPI00148862CE|nr:hypothetical protein [Ruegeria sp. HKCCD8929]